MKYQKKVIVIVGAYSTGKYLAPNFIARGYQCIHIQPGENLNAYFLDSFVATDFITNIIWQNDDEAVLEALSPYEVKIVLPGCEVAVPLADRLSAKLSLPTTNKIELSDARRNKYLMQEALKSADLSSIKQIKTSDLGALFSWIQQEKIQFPIVVKPIASAGTDQVFICHDQRSVDHAFHKIINTQNYLGLHNHEVLAQTFLKGHEYVVNTVSYDGKHYVTDILRVHKKIIDQAPVYDYAELLSPIDDHFCHAK